MGVQFSYTPPAVNAAIALTAAKPGIEHAAAELILTASEPLVPVDTGKLVGTGRVEQGADGASIIYDAVADDGYAYGVRQHEDLSLNHPNGGQAKFLEAPMHSEAPAVAALMAEAVRRVLSL